jgi:hypothetical protein
MDPYFYERSAEELPLLNLVHNEKVSVFSLFWNQQHATSWNRVLPTVERWLS